MTIKWNKLNRQIHFWGSAAVAIPILIVIVTGVILLLKKDIDWIQPPTHHGQGAVPKVSFVQILNAVKSVEEAGITEWNQIDRLDVRPKKGVIKVRAKNSWEIQLDHQTTEVLHVAYRRSDLIESIHDGTFFHDSAKFWVFLPSAIILLVLWITGIYLFTITMIARNKKKRKKQLANNIPNGMKEPF